MIKFKSHFILPNFCVYGWGKSNNLFWGQIFNNLWKSILKKIYCITKSLIILEKITKKGKTPKTNDKNRCNYLQYERVLKFSTFIFWILLNLAKYTYGQSTFEKHHKIGGRKKNTHTHTHTHTLGGRGHLVYILSLIPYFLNK